MNLKLIEIVLIKIIVQINNSGITQPNEYCSSLKSFCKIIKPIMIPKNGNRTKYLLYFSKIYFIKTEQCL